MDQTLWKSVLGEIEVSVSHATFTTWFKDTELIEHSDDSMIIAVANIFAKRQFEVKFDPKVRSVLKKNGIETKKISYTVKTNSKRKVVSRETTASHGLPTLTRNESIFTPHALDVSINQKYTFDSFVVGSSNDLAYAACQAVANDPGNKYNPLFLYGGVGLGKTHLMQAVGNEILKNNPRANVVYINTETFVKEFTDAIRFKKKVSDKYRKADVFIVDDMQFIAGKEKTQEEFFHTFNILHQSNRQIIISSDKPPRSIPTLTERLRSRFEWGMAIDIQMPDFETRCAILQSKAATAGFELEKDVVEYIAENVKSNIRELEGALNQLLAYSEMRGITPDISIVKGLLGNVRRTRPHYLTSRQIIEKTAKYFQISPEEICSAKRDKHIVTPRQVAMYLLRSELHLSFPKIAIELGRKDHTTAIHSIEKIEKAIKLDISIRENVNEIREGLYV
ncbi:MAG: chromosomal replication initiator protein DnaA [Candidatus Saccharimonadales bacterium]